MTRIDCASARELMLEADLDELRGGGAPLALHIAGCAQCRAVAAALLSGYDDLDAGLKQLAAVPLRAHGKWRKTWRWAPVPLAAAAVLALLLAQRQEQPITPPTLLTQLLFRADPVVTPPPGKDALFMEKNDLTVVWLY